MTFVLHQRPNWRIGSPCGPNNFLLTNLSQLQNRSGDKLPGVTPFLHPWIAKNLGAFVTFAGL